jgi:hypothetical protein
MMRPRRGLTLSSHPRPRGRNTISTTASMTGISTGHQKPALKIALPQPAFLGKLCE